MRTQMRSWIHWQVRTDRRTNGQCLLSDDTRLACCYMLYLGKSESTMCCCCDAWRRQNLCRWVHGIIGAMNSRVYSLSRFLSLQVNNAVSTQFTTHILNSKLVFGTYVNVGRPNILRWHSRPCTVSELYQRKFWLCNTCVFTVTCWKKLGSVGRK